MNEPPHQPEQVRQTGRLARARDALARDLRSKTFLAGLGEQLLRGGQATVALTGLDAYLKDAAKDFDVVRAALFAVLGCIGIVIGLYLKAVGERR